MIRIIINLSLFCNSFQYFAKKSSKDFKGIDTTKAAIEASKKVKGRQRFLVLSEKHVKILKRDAKVVFFLDCL